MRQREWMPQARALRQDLAVILLDARPHAPPAELVGATAARLRETEPFLLAAQQVHDRPGQLLMLLWWHEQPIDMIANDRAEARDVRRDHGAPARHRLQQHNPLALTACVRRAIDMRRGIERGQILRRHTPREDDIRPAGVLDELLEAGAQRAVA